MTERRDFLKKLGLALGAIGLGRVEIRNGPEGSGSVLIRGKLRPSSGAEPLDLEFRVPDSLDSPVWSELGFSQEEILAMAHRDLIVRMQMFARRVLRDVQMGEESCHIEDLRAVAQEAVDNYSYSRPRMFNPRIERRVGE